MTTRLTAEELKKNLYGTLEVPPNASKEAIKIAYLKLARIYHPDSNKSPGASEKMVELNVAYGILSDPDKRRIYDTAHPNNSGFKPDTNKTPDNTSEAPDFRSYQRSAPDFGSYYQRSTPRAEDFSGFNPRSNNFQGSAPRAEDFYEFFKAKASNTNRPFTDFSKTKWYSDFMNKHQKARPRDDLSDFLTIIYNIFDSDKDESHPILKKLDDDFIEEIYNEFDKSVTSSLDNKGLQNLINNIEIDKVIIENYYSPSLKRILGLLLSVYINKSKATSLDLDFNKLQNLSYLFYSCNNKKITAKGNFSEYIGRYSKDSELHITGDVSDCFGQRAKGSTFIVDGAAGENAAGWASDSKFTFHGYVGNRAGSDAKNIILNFYGDFLRDDLFYEARNCVVNFYGGGITINENHGKATKYPKNIKIVYNGKVLFDSSKDGPIPERYLFKRPPEKPVKMDEEFKKAYDALKKGTRT